MPPRTDANSSYYCPKCETTILGMCKSSHLSITHQTVCRIRFRGRGEREMKSERSLVTGRFHCPRCSASYINPRQLQQHASKFCPSLGVVAKVERFSPPKANKPTTPAKQLQRKLLPIAPKPTPGRTRTRHGGPYLSRTQRAIARQLYGEQTHTNKEIAEFLKCDPRDVHFAIQNESNDNVDEDQYYLDGVRGELIDVDKYQDSSETYLKAEDAEVMEVDEKLVVDFENEEDSEQEVEKSYMHSPRTPEPQALTSLSPRLMRAQRTKASPKKQENLPPVPPVPPSTESPRRIAKELPNISESEQTSSRRASDLEYSHSPSVSTNITVPSTSQTLSDDPIEMFLCSLKRPCGHLTRKFKEYGIASAADLDALCQMQEYWSEVEHYFIGQGVTPFEWLVVQEGLRARASKVPAGKA